MIDMNRMTSISRIYTVPGVLHLTIDRREIRRHDIGSLDPNYKDLDWFIQNESNLLRGSILEAWLFTTMGYEISIFLSKSGRFPLIIEGGSCYPGSIDMIDPYEYDIQ
jgi:hypothetical protein